MSEQHLIQKYRFDVGFNSEAKSFALQKELSVCIREKIVPATDAIFEEVGAGLNVGINKLVIDLGEISYDNFEEEMLSKFRSKLSDKLKLILSGFSINPEEDQVDYFTAEESDLGHLKHFFQHGYLSWSARRSNESLFVSSTIVKYLDTQPDLIKKLFAGLLSDHAVVIRVIRQLEDEVLWRIISLVTSSELAVVKTFYKNTLSFYHKKPVLKNTRAEYRELVWKFLVVQGIPDQFHSKKLEFITQEFIRFVAREQHTTSSEMATQLVVQLLNLSNAESESVRKELLSQSYEAKVKKLKEIVGQPDLDTFIQVVASLTDSSSEKGTTANNKPDSAREKKMREERARFEKYQKQVFENRIAFLQKFLTLVDRVDSNAIGSYIPNIEFLIQDIYSIDPAHLKAVLIESGLKLEERHVQILVLHFKPEISLVFLKEGFSVDLNQFLFIKQESERKAVVQFFETGIYPFAYLRAPNIDPGAINRLIKDFKATSPEVIRDLIQKNIERGPRKGFIIRQLHRYLSEEVVQDLFSEFSDLLDSNGEKQKKGKLNSDAIVKSSEELLIPENAILALWYFLEKKSFPVSVVYSLEEVVAAIVRISEKAASIFFQSLTKKELEIILKEIPSSLTEKVNSLLKPKADPSTDGLNHLVEEFRISENDFRKEKEKSKKVIEDLSSDPVYEFRKAPMGDPVYIANAGLVLFHPFLSRFFKMLQLVDKKEFKDEYSAHKAAHLLQYLANKTIQAEEHEMVLNKLICGIDLSVPLMRDIEITDEDKNTCESLIEGVIQNWPILKKTSNDNFRSSFLAREGRLLLEPQGWKLRVEERGYDILVEKLPWSIGMVKLPWMEKVIYVEWK